MIQLRTITSKILIWFSRHEGLDLLTSGRGEGVFDPELVSTLLATLLLTDGVEFGDSDAMALALTGLSLNRVTSSLEPGYRYRTYADIQWVPESVNFNYVDERQF